MTLDVHSCVDGWLQRARGASLALLALLCCSWAPGLQADVLDGQLDVLSAYVVVDNGVYKLMARAVYPLNEDIRAALKDGVALRFDFETVLTKQRRFMPDATVADLVLQRELSWHMVSERYVVRDGERGEQRTHEEHQRCERGPATRRVSHASWIGGRCPSLEGQITSPAWCPRPNPHPRHACRCLRAPFR
jgi:hypothetical protein